MIGKSNVLSLDLLLIGEKTQKLRKTRNYYTKRTNFGDREQKLNVEKFMEFLTILCQSRVSSTIPPDSVDEEEEDEEYQVRPGVEDDDDDDECEESFQKAALQAFKKMNSSLPQNRKKLKEKTIMQQKATGTISDSNGHLPATSIETSPKARKSESKRVKRVPYNVKENGLNKQEKGMFD